MASAAAQRRRYKQLMAFGRALLLDRCACGETEGLRFVHRDRRTRLFQPAAKTGYALERWVAEVLKCDLLCRLCHLKRKGHRPYTETYNHRVRTREAAAKQRARWRQNGLCIQCGKPCGKNPVTQRTFSRCLKHRMRQMRIMTGRAEYYVRSGTEASRTQGSKNRPL